MPSHRLFLYSYAGVAGLCCAGALLLLSGALSAAENAVHQKPHSISLQISNEIGTELKLEVRQAPLGRVLKEIASKTGARIHYSVLPEAPVTATCVGATVRQIMDCLVAKQVGLVANRPEQGKPAEFWLLGSSVGSCQAVTIEPTQPILAVAEQPVTPTPEQQAQIDQGNQDQSDALLEQFKKSKDKGQRSEALNNLVAVGKIDDPNVRKALEDAMMDKDESIRAQAVETLANLDKDNASDYLGRALQDKSPEVRIAALGKAGDHVEILERALSDTDTNVSQYAAAMLAQLKKQSGR